MNTNVQLKSIGSLKINDNVITAINGLSNFLDKRIDNEVSGNLSVSNHDLLVNNGDFQIISGNAIVGNNNFLAVNEPNLIVGENNSIGVKGYKVSGIQRILDESENTLCVYLSIDVTAGKIDNALQVGTYYSIDAPGAFIDTGKILSVNVENNIIVVDKVTKTSIPDYPLPRCNIYFREFPNIGNILIGDNTNLIVGNNNKVLGHSVVALGYMTQAFGNYAHTEGKRTVASWGAHAQNAANEAKGECSHAQGRVNRALSKYSTVAGVGNTTSAAGSFAIGCMSLANDKYSFVWNGKQLYGYNGVSSTAYDFDYPMNWALSDASGDEDTNALDYLTSQYYHEDAYKSNGKGTFNINPEGGVSGFYIGDQSLGSILGNTVETVNGMLSSSSMFFAIDGAPAAEIPTELCSIRIGQNYAELDGYGPTTDYIEVIPLEKISIYACTKYNCKAYVFYDADKNPIESYPVGAAPSEWIKYKELVVPKNAKYIRASCVEGNRYELHRTPHVYRISNAQSIENISADILNTAQYQVNVTGYRDLLDIYQVSSNIILNAGKSNPVAVAGGTTTDFIKIDDLANLSVTATSKDTTTILQYYDSHKIYIGDDPEGYKKEGSTYIRVDWVDKALDIDQIKQDYPTAEYVRFCSYGGLKLKLVQDSMPLPISTVIAELSIGMSTDISEIRRNTYCGFPGQTINIADYANPEIELSVGFQNSGPYHAYSGIGRTTQKLTLDEADGLSVTARSAESTMVYNYFKEDGTYLTADGFAKNESGGWASYIVENEALSKKQILSKYPSAYYIRICSYGKKLEIYRKKTNNEVLVDLSSNLVDQLSGVDPTAYAGLVSADVFFRQKYVALGDSFTAILVGYDEDVESEGYDAQMGMWRTYPYWIAKRHQMQLTNGAKNGQSMRYQESKASNCGAILYQNLSAQLSAADFITLSFGQNEGVTAETVGTKNDSNISSEWGAWNTVLSAIYTWNPDVHIGIIGYEGTSELTIQTHKAIAEWWGIPYYDLRGDVNTPLILDSGKIGISINPFAANARRNAFKSYNKDGSVNMHPNLAAHKYKANIIENFMRGI